MRNEQGNPQVLISLMFKKKDFLDMLEEQPCNWKTFSFKEKNVKSINFKSSIYYNMLLYVCLPPPQTLNI